MKNTNILDLCPTQFVLGMKEIEYKVEKIKKFSDRELKKYCDDHVIPVVIGPRKQHYLVDHHHFARACWETGAEHYSTEVIKDLSHLDVKDFWNVMIKNNWTYLHDQFGMGPHSPLSLPSDIRCMADDPYRSLAWALVNNEVIKKIDVLFYEFQWAAFFRQNLEVALHSKSDFKESIRQATQLAKSKSAAHLPGFKKR